MKKISKKEQKCLERIIKSFPGIFNAPSFGLDEPRLYFCDPHIYPGPMFVSLSTDDLVYMESNQGELQLYLEFYPSMGVFTMKDDFKLPLDISVKLFNVNIDIAYVENGFNNTIIYYDKEVIIRGHTINQILK